MSPEAQVQVANHRASRNLGRILARITNELQSFLETRIAILKTELREKVSHWKLAFPSAGMALLLGLLAYLLINIALVALIAVFIAGPFRWFFAFLALGGLWLVLGSVAAYIAMQEMSLQRVLPRRTIETLKGDKVWLQKEMHNQIRVPFPSTSWSCGLWSSVISFIKLPSLSARGFPALAIN